MPLKSDKGVKKTVYAMAFYAALDYHWEKYMNVLLTGISSGLGLALAKTLLDNRHRVYGISRKTPAISSPDLEFAAIDLARLDTIEAGLSQLLSGVDSLDLVVLNAGILGEIRDLSATPMDDLKQIMDINLWSNKVLIDFLLSSAIQLKQIVAISSGASVSGQRGWSGYGISKAALNMLVKLYAAENPDIHFTALAPGLVYTPMQDLIALHPDPEKFPVVKRLISSRGTSDMPDADQAASRMIEAFPKLLQMESGNYLDIRKMDFTK